MKIFAITIDPETKKEKNRGEIDIEHGINCVMTYKNVSREEAIKMLEESSRFNFIELADDAIYAEK